MNKLKQVYKESKLKLESMTIIMIIMGLAIFIFSMISIAVPFSTVPNYLDQGFFASYDIMQINYFAITPIVVVSIIIVLLYNAKNSKKSFDNIGATNETYCISNYASLLAIAVAMSVMTMLTEIIVLVIAGSLPTFPIGDLDKVTLMMIVGKNFGIYIATSYMAMQLVTYLLNNAMNRNYGRAAVLLLIPFVLLVAFVLIGAFAFDYDIVNSDLPEHDYYIALESFFMGIEGRFTAVAIGVVISNIVEYVLCLKGGRIR